MKLKIASDEEPWEIVAARERRVSRSVRKSEKDMDL